MLKAFRAQLTQLANDSDKSLEKRFYKAVSYAKAKEYAQDLRNFILSLPELLYQTRIWFESDNTPTELKKVYGYLLTYVYHSLDFLPEEDYGFWGYLDDAYLAGLVYQETLKHNPTSNQRFDTNFASQINDWLDQTRYVIPQHTAKLDQIFESLLQGDVQSFHESIV